MPVRCVFGLLATAALVLCACGPAPTPMLPPTATLIPPTASPTQTLTPLPPSTQAFPTPEPSPTATVDAKLPAPMEVHVTTDVLYSSNRSLDVYRPVSQGSWPVVLFLHGGGMNKSSVGGMATAISGQGIVVFVPTYQSSQPTAKTITVGAEQAACAARFARAHAAEYGGKPGRLVAAGHSAGGAFAVLLALAGDEYKGECQVTDEWSGRVDGVVGLDGAYDLMRYIEPRVFPSAPAEAWLAISPYAQLERQPFHAGLAFRLFAGRETELVQDGQSMRDALTRAGYVAEFTQVPGVDHGGMVIRRAQTVLAIVELARGG